MPITATANVIAKNLLLLLLLSDKVGFDISCQTLFFPENINNKIE